MQGRGEPQAGLTDAAALCGEPVKVGSVTAWQAEHRRELFRDDAFADLFPSARGLPSVPTDVVAMLMVLQGWRVCRTGRPPMRCGCASTGRWHAGWPWMPRGSVCLTLAGGRHATAPAVSRFRPLKCNSLHDVRGVEGRNEQRPTDRTAHPRPGRGAHGQRRGGDDLSVGDRPARPATVPTLSPSRLGSDSRRPRLSISPVVVVSQCRDGSLTRNVPTRTADPRSGNRGGRSRGVPRRAAHRQASRMR